MNTIPPQSLRPSTSQKAVVQIVGDAPAETLSATAATTSATQQFYKPRARANSGGQRRTRTESLTSPTGLPLPLPGSASVSRSPSFTKSPTVASVTSVAHSLTHTGNILPPSAFYRPGRPNSSISRTEHAPAQVVTTHSPLSSAPRLPSTRLTTTRPSSAVSAASSLGVPIVPSTSVHAREHGLMMLQPLSHVHTRGSDDGSASGNDSTPETKKRTHTRSATSPTTRVKPSREQLLPIREKENVGSSQGKVSPALNGVRESLERMFRRTTSSERDRERSYLDEHDRLPVTTEDVRQIRAAPASPASPHSLQRARVAHRQTDSSNYHAATSTTPRAPTHNTYIAPRPPAMTVPVQQKSYGPERNWQVFPSRNTFCLQGRLLTGGDSPWAFLFSLSLVFGIAGVWFGTTCVWWWQKESPAVAAVGIYMCLLTITSMLATVRFDN
jgi:palmitoyltransferase ZDHHC9/14/18